MAPRIAAVGEIVEDRYLDDDGRFLGGISVNFARCAQHLGATAALFAPVGTDELGARLRQELVRTRLALRVRTLAGATARQRIRLTLEGERIFCGFDEGVLPDYEPTEQELEELARFDAVAVPCSRESRRAFRRLACRAWSADKLVADFSKDSPAGDPGRPASWIEPWGNRLLVAFVGGDIAFVPELCALSSRITAPIVLTVGKAGAHAFAGGEHWHEPALTDSVVDTTGCGDAFQAGFTVRYLEDGGIAASLRAGAELAARVAMRRGAAP